jgi:hypothetical protein
MMAEAAERNPGKVEQQAAALLTYLGCHEKADPKFQTWGVVRIAKAGDTTPVLGLAAAPLGPGRAAMRGAGANGWM